jgi:hypothetical protein
MTGDRIGQVLETLKAIQSDNPELRRGVEVLGDALSVGNISGSTGVAIGRNIRMVVNQLNLPAEIVAALLEARNILGGLDPDRYRLGTLLADKTRDFVGREHIFEAIDQFFFSHSSGYFVIEGDPGMGKSAILAEYIRRTGCIAHFNVRAQGIVSAWQFLENVCTQLIVDFGLPYASLPANAIQDGAFLARLLGEASAKLEPGERLIIAVDALDEVDLATHRQVEDVGTTRPSGANILYLPITLPDGVYFIMTRRQVEVPFVVQAPQELLDLMIYPAENRGDVETYLWRSAESPKLHAWIDGQGLMGTEFVTTLADLSESNFMYLRYVLPEIEQGTYEGLSIENLPAGLEGYYEDHWRRMGMTIKPLPRIKIRIVYILSEVRQPVSRSLIAQFANDESVHVDELIVQEVLDEWEQFLHEQLALGGTRYSIYHASFRDFLHRKDIVQAAGVTIQGIHALIADNLWTDLFGPTRGDVMEWTS